MWHVGIYDGAVVAAVVVLCLVHREWKVGGFQANVEELVGMSQRHMTMR